MTVHPQSVALNMRVSPGVRQRLEVLAARYDATLTSMGRVALVVGLEALEKMRDQLPRDPGTTDPGD